MRDLIKPVYTRLWQVWVRIAHRPKGRYPIVHQGIQRSGTNYLSAMLEAADYRVLNRIDPRRDDPRHKHFRWQFDKETIVMHSSYRNTCTARSVDDVNAISGWPHGCRHLVLFRDPRDWMDAIFRWGIANHWFASEDAFIAQGLHRAYLREWHAYYAQWASFARRDPNLVTLLRYNDLKLDPNAGLRHIDAFAGIVRSAPVNLPGATAKVHHSKSMSKPRKRLSGPEIDQAVAEGGAFEWRTYVNPDA